MELTSKETTSTSTQSAYSAFLQLLRTLCLDEFPCGIGSWRECPPSFKKSEHGNVSNTRRDLIESAFSVTLKDYPVETHKTDDLEELIKTSQSPWKQDYSSWSEEARELRETAIKSPWLVDDSFVHRAFKTLKIIDNNVSYIDENLLLFTNLEELTLSANYIQFVPSKYLPPNLKVLELCGNQISDVESLCQNAPTLLHLGLSYNSLVSTDNYITGDIWPSIVSLDLSHNHLTDMFATVSRLSTLPKLRNLILQGNPLFLVPGYRGYVVDSIRLLQILDDRRITADEKHNFRGLAKHKDDIIEEVKMKISVGFIKGLPVPPEVKKPADRPEYPLIDRTYYLEFLFPPKSVVDFMTSDFDDGTSIVTSRSGKASKLGESRADNQVADSDVIDESNVLQSRMASALSKHSQVTETSVRHPSLDLAPIRTAAVPYGDEVELNWSQVYSRDDTTQMRDFMKTGMKVTVVEEKVLVYPADLVNQTPDSKKDKKKDKKDEKTKGKPDDKKDDKKKKKKESDMDLHRMPPEYTTLAQFFLPLADFLDGENVFQTTFSHQEVVLESVADVPGKTARKDSVKKEHARSSKTGSSKRDSIKTSTAKAGKDKEKGKGTDKAVVLADGEEEEAPHPLEVSVGVTLVRYESAVECLRSVQSPAPVP